jgi:hypothetical protein
MRWGSIEIKKKKWVRDQAALSFNGPFTPVRYVRFLLQGVTHSTSQGNYRLCRHTVRS